MVIQTKPHELFVSTWDERYRDEFLLFLKEKVNENNPYYIIPVARKACKLIDTCEKDIKESAPDISEKFRYKDYFRFNKVSDFKDKKIAIIDDVSRSTESLKRYREHFIKKYKLKDENIFTYAFKGHYSILADPKSKKDKNAEIGSFLKNYEYHNYLFLQANHFILSGEGTDIDHIVLEIKNFPADSIEKLKKALSKLGYLYKLNPIEHLQRFSLHCNLIKDYKQLGRDFGFMPDDRTGNDFIMDKDFVEKIRFFYYEDRQRLLCIPLVFPKMNRKIYFDESSTVEVFKEIFKNLYCSEVSKSSYEKDEVYFDDINLVLGSLLSKYVFQQIVKSFPELTKYFGGFDKDFRIIDSDLKKYYTDYQKIINSINAFYRDKGEINHYFNENTSFNFQPEFTMSKDCAHQILKRLRDCYSQNEEIANPNGKRQVEKYSETIDELLKKGNSKNNLSEENKEIHPLVLTELIDDLCDFGILVPSHNTPDDKNNEGIFHRTYRSGENNPDKHAWYRSKYILYLAIDVAHKYRYTIEKKVKKNESIEQSKKVAVVRMLLEKLIGNFAYDFPHYHDTALQYYFDNHCFDTKPSYWGAQVMVADPIEPKKKFYLDDKKVIGLKAGLIPLENQKKYSLGIYDNLYAYDFKSETFGTINITAKQLDELNDYINPEIKNYFRFLVSSNQFKPIRTSPIDRLNALLLCRNYDWYCSHIFHNIKEWAKTFSDIIEKIENTNDLFDIKELYRDIVDIEGKQLASIQDKIKFAKNFKILYDKCEDFAKYNMVDFGKIWFDAIKPNIEVDDFIAKFKIIQKDLESLLNGLLAASSLLRTRFNLYISMETAESSSKYLAKIDDELKDIGINFSAYLDPSIKSTTVTEYLALPVQNNRKVIINTLMNISSIILNDKIAEYQQKAKYNDELEENIKQYKTNLIKRLKNYYLQLFPSSEQQAGLNKLLNFLQEKASNETDIMEMKLLNNPQVDKDGKKEYIHQLGENKKFKIKTKLVKSKTTGNKIEIIERVEGLNVFISYSHDYETPIFCPNKSPDLFSMSKDNQYHKVKILVEKLEKEDYKIIWDGNKSYSNGFTNWMNDCIKHDKVIVVLSPGYKDKIDNPGYRGYQLKKEYAAIVKYYNEICKTKELSEAINLFHQKVIFVTLENIEDLDSIKLLNFQNAEILTAVLNDEEKFQRLKNAL